MNDVIALIDKIIEEHQAVFSRFRKMEGVFNDVQAMAGIEVAKEAFMPGRFDQKEGLKSLKESLDVIEQGLIAHFNREETALVAAFDKYADRALVSALNALLLHHGDLRKRIEDSKKQLAELVGGGMGQHTWQASAHDIRAHITHTRKMIEAHAASEMPLLLKLRKKMESEPG